MPNGANKVNGAVPKFYDSTLAQWRPFYVLPDGTDKVQGGVFLTDDYTTVYDAAKGMTAASPVAVQNAVEDVQDFIDDNLVLGVKGGNEDKYRIGQVNLTPENIGAVDKNLVVSTFEGATGYTIPTTNAVETRIQELDGSWITSGTIPLDRLPQGALERLVRTANEASMKALTASDVQNGDTVQRIDTGIMYVVVDQTKLATSSWESAFQEFTAATAASVEWSNVQNKPTNATSSTAGLMSAADKSKLDGIASSANNYTLPNATSSTLGGIKVGTGLSVSSGVLSVTLPIYAGTADPTTNGYTNAIYVKYES